MALTTMIQYDEEWKSFFKTNIPAKNEFKTLSGHKAFSNEYCERAKYSLSNRYYSTVVGTAFDYLARWLIAKHVPSNANESYGNLIAENYLYMCQHVVDNKKMDVNMQDTYDNAIETCKQFIQGQAEKSKIIEIAILFAKLEQLYRRQAREWDIDIDYLFQCESEIVSDLENLCGVFEDQFIHNLLKKHSTVVYNPTFGGASVICGGADADIYIDGTLYDFKCTKKHGYVWNEVAQIVGYYLLDCISKKNEDKDNYLKGHEIKRVAFYRARYGEVEYVDISDTTLSELIDTFEDILGKDKYQEYFERIKARELEMQAQQEAIRKKELEEKRLYKKLLKSGDKNEIMLYKIKKFCGYGDWFDQDIRNCKDKKRRKQLLQWTVEWSLNSLVYSKIDVAKLKRIMEKNNITVEDISKYTGKTIATVKKWTKGQSTPRVGSFIKLLEILNCNKEDIIINNR